MKLVKILKSDNGEPVDKDAQVWHLVDEITSSPATFCDGEFFGPGESPCEYIIKDVKRGGITCLNCLRRIKRIKSIKL